MIVLAAAAALFAFLAYTRSGRTLPSSEITAEVVSQLLRNESDRTRQASDEQARALRQELGDNLTGFQDTTLNAFRHLGDTLGAEAKEFGGRLDNGVKTIDDRAAAIGTTLDQDIGWRRSSNRDGGGVARTHYQLLTRSDQGASQFHLCPLAFLPSLIANVTRPSSPRTEG